MTPDPALAAAYAATEYRFTDGEAIYRLRIDEPNPAVDGWLRAQGATAGAFISNCNPAGEKHSDKANTQRTTALQRWLTRQGLPYRIGLGVPPENQDWSPEASFFLPGIAQDKAEKIARHCEQLAWVWHAVGAETRLIWTQGAPQ